MKKEILLQNTTSDKEQILRALRAAYAGEIYKELTRLLGFADRDAVEKVLEAVRTRLPEWPAECDVSLLVSDSIRKEAVSARENSPAAETHTSPGQRFASRRLRVAKYAIPICCALLLVALLLLYFFPPF